jgi:hypothetical protein
VRVYKPDGSNVELCRQELVKKGAVIFRPTTPGCELAEELLPEQHIRLNIDLLLAGGIQQIGDQEVIIYKPRWGCFYKTPLDEHLQKLGVTSLAFTGCNFPNCPRTSIYEASERDFRIVLVEDAVSGLYKRGKDEIRNIGVYTMRAKGLEEAIGSVQPRMVKLRSPREALGGYIILPRLIDKVRLHAQGKLPPEYVENLLKPGLTLDGRFLTFTGSDAEGLRKAILSAKTDEEVLAWVEHNARPRSFEEKQRWAEEIDTYRPDPIMANRRKEVYSVLASKIDVTAVSILDLIDMDEGQIPIRG